MSKHHSYIIDTLDEAATLRVHVRYSCYRASPIIKASYGLDQRFSFVLICFRFLCVCVSTVGATRGSVEGAEL